MGTLIPYLLSIIQIAINRMRNQRPQRWQQFTESICNILSAWPGRGALYGNVYFIAFIFKLIVPYIWQLC